MEDNLEKALADATLRRNKVIKNFTSTGVRELDEMLGGGFMPGSMTLIQQDLGSGGEIILSKIIEIQLSLSNVILVIITDPTMYELEKLLQEIKSDRLIILNLREISKKNMNMMYDKHEISLKLRDSRLKALELLNKLRTEEKDPDIQLFSFLVSFNPFVLNLSPDNVIRILNDIVLQTVDQNTIDLFLLNKNILSAEMLARVQSLCHCVVDLKSYFEGVQKKNEICILKMIGRYYDIKIEPYVLTFDDKTLKYQFMIKSAFLTSFETFRNLLTWNKGSVALAKQSYIVAPMTYLNSLLEMPYNMDPKKGEEEIIEKAQGIGRRLAIMVEKLYFVEGTALLDASLQMASLMGWGNAKIIVLEMEENLLELIHESHKDFSFKVYIPFLEGYYKGLIKRTLGRGIRYVKITKDEEQKENSPSELISYKIKVRLTRLSEEETDKE